MKKLYRVLAIISFSLFIFNESYSQTTTIAQTTNGIANSPLMAGATDRAIIGFSLVSTNAGSPNFTGINIQTSTTTIGKLINLKFYESDDDDYSTVTGGGVANTQLTCTINQTATQIAISAFTPTIALKKQPRYFFLVADVDASVTSATPSFRPTFTQANVTVSAGSKTAVNIQGQLFAFTAFVANPGNCDANVPQFTVNLTGAPDSLWISPNIRREPICCGYNAGPPDNFRCVSFWLTLDPDAGQIVFDIHSGAAPSGALGWSFSCVEPLNPVGEPICVNDPGPHFITFCKPGANKNEYSIRSIPKPTVTPPVTVSNGCNTVLNVTDVVASTVTWTSVPFNATHNSYLSCTSGCTSTTATYQAGAPDSVLYAVQGTPTGGCSTSVFRDTTWVYFVNDKVVSVPNGIVCFGGTNTTLTAFSSGGKPPYFYSWTPGGQTTQSINVGVGTYTVTVTDASGCPPGVATAEVTANPSPVSVNAGADRTVCRNNLSIQLAGTFVLARRGRWSCATCTPSQFSPNDSTANAVFTPTAAQAAGATLTLTYTSIGHEPCPQETDNMVITFTNTPIVNAGPNQALCSNNPVIQLAGTVTNAGGGRWSGGAGTYFANDSTLTATYAPSATEISNGFVILTLTSIQNGNCSPVTDTTRFSFYPAPILNAIANQTVCGNNAATSLTATGSNLTGATLLWTSSGSGSFSPTNALNTTYTPSSTDITAGTVTLTLSASRSGCNPVTRSMVLTIQPAPTSNPGANRTACKNNPQVCLTGTVTNHTSFVWTTSGTGTFTNGTTLTPCYNPSAADLTAGTVTICLRASRAGCTDVTNCLTITYTNSPTIDAGTAGPVCANNATVSLSGSGLTVATGVQWTGGSGTFTNSTAISTTYNPSATERNAAPTSVKLYLSTTGNGTCLAARDSVIFNITPAPIVNAGNDITVCSNNNVANISGTATINGATITGVWTTSGTGSFGNANNLTTTYTPSATDINAGSVTLTLTSVGHGNCSPVSDNLILTISPAPTANAGANQTVCANNNQVCLNGTATNFTTVAWSTSGTGTFTNGNTLTACYTPSAADITATTFTLTLTATRAGCSPVTSSLTVNVTPSPVVTFTTPNPMCANNAVVQLNATVTNATGVEWLGATGNFNPSNAVLNPIYTASTAEINAGSVTFVIRSTGNGNCNSVQQVLDIPIYPLPQVFAGNDQSICKNNNVISLSGTVTDLTGGAIPTNSVWTSSGTGSISGQTTTTAGSIRTITATYTPSAADLTAGTVTFTLTANTTGVVICNPIPDQMVVTFTNPPVVNAGPAQSVCANNPVTNLVGTVTIATGGTWTTSGSGTFANANSLATTYTPSNNDITAGTVTLTLTSTGNGTCNPVSHSMVLTITPAPTVNPGANQTVCANKSTVSLNGSVTVATGGVWSSSGTGTFIPNANQLNAQYLPSPADTVAGTVTLTLTTTGNANCNPVSNSMVVTITPAPLVEAGNPLTSCVNNPSVVLAGTVVRATGGIWTGGGGTFNPNNTILNATYTPSNTEINSGSVILTLTTTGNGNCNALSDQVTITIVPSPIVSAGSNQTLCGNATTVTMNGTVTNATGGIWTTSGTGTFNNPNLLNSVYTPSATDKTNGIVTLTLTSTGNGTCNPESSSMTVTFTEVPTANAGADMTVCTNDFPIQLNGSGSNSEWLGGTGVFTPSRNVLNPTYTPSAGEISSGSVTLTLQTIAFGACNVVSDNITITTPAGPIVNAGDDFTVCGDITTINLAGTIQNATGGVWTSNGTGTFTNATSLTTTFTPSNLDKINGGVRFVLTSTGNGNCSAESDTIFVTITTAPTINAGPDYTICADQTSINLVATVTVATGGTWSTSNGTGQFGSINSLNTTYLPSIGDTITKTINICVTSTNQGSCNAVTDCMVLNITPAPIVNAGANQTICADATSISISGTVSSAASGGIWSTSGSGTFSPSVTNLNATYIPSQADKDAGSVTLTLTSTGNQNCGPVSSTMTLTITPAPTVNPGSDFSVCADSSSFAVNGTVTVATGGTWTTSGTGTFTNPNQLSTFYNPSNGDIQAGQVTLFLTSTNQGTCNPVTESVVVTITPAPTVTTVSPLETCADDNSIQLNASVTIATGVTWTTTGNGGFSSSANILNPIYTITPQDTAAGTLTFTATTTGNGHCRAKTATTILVITPKPIVTAGNAETICADNNSIQLAGAISHAGGGVWSTSGTGTFSPNNTTLNAVYSFSNLDKQNGTVTLTLTSTANGQCNAYTSTKVITINPAPIVNAGGNLSVCANNTDVALNGTIQFAGGGTWTTSGTGNFANANSIITTYFPSQTDIDNGGATLTLTSTDNGLCQEVSQSIALTITPAPTITAGGPREMCADANSISLTGIVTISTGGTWTTSGSGSFSPNNNTLSVDYLPSANDKTNSPINLILTSTGNANCVAVIDTVVLTITPAPTINTTDTLFVCADKSSVAIGGNITGATGGVWTTSGTGSFSPSANDISTSYVPSQTDKDNNGIVLTLTTTGNGTCNAINSSTVLRITPAPTVFAGNDITICEGQTATLTGVITVATGGTWTTGSGTGTFGNANNLSTTFIPSALQITNGFASITLTTTGNGTCNSVNDQVFVFIQKNATVDAGPNQNICASTNTVQLNGVITGSSTTGTWTTTGDGTFVNANLLNAVYIPSNNEKTAGTVKLYLTSTNNAFCSAVTDSMTIGFTPVPSINLTQENFCANQGNITLNSTRNNASGVIWTTSGTGTFTPPTGANTVYTTSANDNTTGSVNIFVSTTGTNPCPAARDSVLISITPLPTANAGNDIITCANSAPVTLNGTVGGNATGGIWVSLGGGTFTPSNTTLNATYTPSATDIQAGKAKLYLTTTGVGTCIPKVDTVDITITPAPTVSTSSNQTICADNLATVSANVTIATGVTWTTSGNGTFGTPNELTTTYTPGSDDINNGTVTLTATTSGNGLCTAVSSQTVLTITPAPTVTLGDDQEYCNDIAATYISAVTTVATGVTWQTTGTGTISFPSASNTKNILYTFSNADFDAGIVHFYVETTGNGTCNTRFDTLSVELYKQPVVTVTTGTLCADADSVQVSGTVTHATHVLWETLGSGVYAPHDTTLTTYYYPSNPDKTAGNVTLLLSPAGFNSVCPLVKDTILLNIITPPTINAGTDITVCADADFVPLNGSFLNASGVLWSTLGTGTFTNATSATSNYILSNADTAAHQVQLVLTSTGNGLCNAVTDTVKITITPAPFVDAGPAIVCGNNPIINLNGIIRIATGAVWSTSGDGNFGNINLLTTTYNMGTNDLGGSGVTLYLTTTGNGDCKVKRDSIIVNVADSPFINVENDKSVCADVTTVPVSVLSFGNASGIIWSSSSNGTFANNISTNTNYTVSQTDKDNGSVIIRVETTGNGNCLASKDSFLLTITPAPTVNANVTTICIDRDTVQLPAATITVATGVSWTSLGGGTFLTSTSLAPQYIFSNADKSNTFADLIVTTTNQGTCNAVSDTIHINLTPPPSANAGTDIIICATQTSVPITGTLIGTTTGVWSIVSGFGTGTFANATSLSTTYNVTNADTTRGIVKLLFTTTNVGTCNPNSDTLVITITPRPRVSTGGGTMTVCADLVTIPLPGNVVSGNSPVWTLVNGNGSFAPNTPNGNYIRTNDDVTAGFVKMYLTLTGNGVCTNDVVDTLTINITPAPTVDAGNGVICADNTSVNFAATITVATGVTWTSNGTGFFTSPNSLTTSYVPSNDDRDNGIVMVYVTTTGNGTCNSVKDSVQLNITPPPSVEIDILTDTYCEQVPDIDVNGTIIGATGAIWTSSSNGTFGNATSLNTTYTPNQTDIDNATVTLYLTTTGVGNCNARTDSFTVFFEPAPQVVVNAGDDLEICAEQQSVQLNGSISNAGGGEWTHNGSGFFDNATSLTPTYFIHPDDTTAGIVNITLTSTGNGLCDPVVDDLVITFTSVPVINAGPDTIKICADAPVVTLNGTIAGSGGYWTTGGSGQFGNASLLNTTYTLSTGDIQDSLVVLTLFSDSTTGCSQGSKNIVLVIAPSPEVTVVTPFNICADQQEVDITGTIQNAGGALWTTNGTGTFADATQITTKYFPSAQDTVNRTVILTLSATNIGSCNPVSADVTINITPAPIIDLGTDFEICADQRTITLNPTLMHISGGNWSSSGNGTFSPSSASIDVNYTVTDNDTTAGVLVFTFMPQNTTGCLNQSQTITVDITPTPLVEAGQNQTICADETSITLSGTVTSAATGGVWSTTGTGNFGNANNLNTTYTPSNLDISTGQVTLTLTSTGQGTCNPVSDNMQITITPAPTIEIGNDIIVCADKSSIGLSATVTIASGVQWTTNGNGNFSSPNTFTTNYIPVAADTAAGSIKIFAVSTGQGTCNPVRDSLTITFTPAPIISAGNNITVCADVTQVQLTGTVSSAVTGFSWSTAGSGQLIPNNTELNPVYIPTANDVQLGEVGFTLSTTNTVNGCNNISSITKIIFTPAPTVTTTDTLRMCADENSIAVTAQITTASGIKWTTAGTGTFAPSDSVLTTNYTPSTSEINAGLAFLTATTTGNGTCNAVNSKTVIKIAPTPIVEAGNDLSVCEDNGPIQLAGTVNNAEGGIWTTSGTGAFFINESFLNATYTLSQNDIQNGSVMIKLTSTGNGRCQAVSDSFEINITKKAIVNAGDADACADANGIDISGTVTNAPGGEWTTSGTGNFAPNSFSLNATYVPSADDIQAGSVILTLTSTGNGDCAPVSQSINLIITELPIADGGMSQLVCRGSETMLIGQTFENLTYSWQTTTGSEISNTNIANITANADTNFVLIVTDAKGCKSSDTITVLVNDPPTLNLPNQICYEEGFTLDAAPSGEPVLGTFQWFVDGVVIGSANTETLPIDRSGVHVIIYNFGNCKVADSTNVTPLPTLETSGKIICEKGNTTLTVNSSTAVSFQWTNASNTVISNSSTANIGGLTSDAIFNVEVTDNLGCKNDTSVTVVVLPPPSIELENQPVCIGDVVKLNATPSNLDNPIGATYSWFNQGAAMNVSATTASIEVTEAGTYSVIFRVGECSATDSSIVTFNAPPVTNADDTIKFCDEQKPTIDINAGEGVTYLWVDSRNTNRIETVDKQGTYYVEVYNEFNCKTLDSVFVKNTCPPRVFVPNAFSPNGDGFDDFFKIFGDHFDNFKITIFNRWGEIIYYSEENRFNWDGTYLGEPQPNGVYQWVLQYSSANPEEYGATIYKEKGSVTIIR